MELKQGKLSHATNEFKDIVLVHKVYSIATSQGGKDKKYDMKTRLTNEEVQ